MSKLQQLGGVLRSVSSALTLSRFISTSVGKSGGVAENVAGVFRSVGLSSHASSVFRRGLHTSPRLFGDDIKYTRLSGNVLGELSASSKENLHRVDITHPSQDVKVVQFENNDVGLNDTEKEGGIIVFSGSGGMEVKYGEVGVMPKNGDLMSTCLKKSLSIPPDSTGVVTIPQYMPIAFVAKDSDNVVVPACSLRALPERMDIEECYSLTKLCDLPHEFTKLMNIRLQDRVYSSKDLEKFFAETTLPVDRPTVVLPNSSTIMIFEQSEYRDKTKMHYHPSERMLFIVTTSAEAGVKMNFCGTREKPSERPDSAKNLDFPENSFLILRFPPGAHHEFFGNFACISVHPNEGKGMIDFIAFNKKFPRDFVRKMFVISGGENQTTKKDLGTSNINTR